MQPHLGTVPGNKHFSNLADVFSKDQIGIAFEPFRSYQSSAIHRQARGGLADVNVGFGQNLKAESSRRS